jgi:5-(carboxyamino)imidazole ribonucleotide mutase
MNQTAPQVLVIMGSKSDWDTMKQAVDVLQSLGVSVEARVASAHRTPDLAAGLAKNAAERGVKVIIAAAGGAAHLAGVLAAYTWIPVLGVPIESKSLKGLDSLLSMVQMPGGIPVGTLAIGSAGAKNAGLLAASIIGLENEAVRKALQDFRAKQAEEVSNITLP